METYLKKTTKEKVMFLFDALNIQENLDASGNQKPMLATDWKKIKKIEYPVYVQPKLDGVRCLMIVSCTNQMGVTSSVQYLSRSGKSYGTLNHITASCDFPEGDYILDGELYSDKLSFQRIVAATKKQTADSLLLQFRCYDVVSTKTQAERISEYQQLVKDLNSPFVTAVETHLVTSQDMVQSLHDKWVQEGYEGAMIRVPNGRYIGARSRELLKVKEFDETEYYFQKFEKGQRDEDLIAVCKTSIFEDAKEFRAKMIGTVEEKEVLFTSNKQKDSLITIKHFGKTEDGLPRFPIGKAFRDE